jgi:type II secretory pathway pseudopilin PulG
MYSLPNRAPRRAAQAGFVLLEFLVAFTMLIVSLSAMFAALMVAIKGDQQAAFLTMGTEFAKGKLAAAGVEYPLISGVSGGTFVNGYAWRVDVRRQGVIASGRGRPITGYRVEVTVSDPRANGRRSVTLVGFEIEQGAPP